MNRKQRRGQKNARSAAGDSEVQSLFATGARLHQAGRLGEAEQLYRRILTLDAGHADSLHRLGVIALQTGQAAIAADFLRQAVASDGGRAAYHSHLSLALAELAELDAAVAAGRTAVRLEPGRPDLEKNLGVILVRCGRLNEAAECYRNSRALDPSPPDTHLNLGDVLLALGEAGEAVICYRQALERLEDFPEAHTGLGSALLDLGQTDEAIAHHRRAISLAPEFADAHNNLGDALWRLGRLAEAEGHFRTTVRLSPGLVEAHSNLAGVLKARGDLDGAIASLTRALQIAPERPDIFSNLAQTLLAQGDPAAAMSAAIGGLERGETAEGGKVFVDCARRLHLEAGVDDVRPWLLRALQAPWGRPDDLARFTARVILHGLDLHNDGDLWTAARDPLLHALLRATPNVDLSLEHCLTRARRALLDAAIGGSEPYAEASIAFHAALAQQCFLNEYVFNHTEAELERASALAGALAAALEAGEAPPASWLLAVATYFPLGSVALATDLLKRAWPSAVEAVLAQQITEPEEERRLRGLLPRLTPIDDSASKRVRAQYEENPYPRWVHPDASGPPQGLVAHLRQKFPFAAIGNPPETERLDVLMAGCGTGRNAIETARKFRHTSFLAIDLSLASLGHAARKSRELGLDGIAYAQADLLELKRIDRRFHFIEATGVLHHLGDPLAGWETLLSLLHPGGFMKVGLYSQLARRNLPDLRPLTTQALPMAEAVRHARRALAARDDVPSRTVLQAADFYAVSPCRDLLFHVQETRFTLAEIDQFLRTKGLRFIGFEIDDAVLAAYRRSTPADPGAGDLAAWRRFEEENPDTFPAMYQFWVQKA